MHDRSTALAEPPLTPAEWRNLGFRISEMSPVHGGYVTADPPPEPDFDMHYGLELGVVLSGRMRRLWRTWEAELEPGQMWFCGMWERHGWQVLTPGCRHFVFVLLPQFLLHARFQEAPDLDWMAPFAVPPHQRPHPPEPTRRELLALMRRSEPNLSTANPQRAVSLELVALEVLLLALQGWTAPRRRSPAPPEPHYVLVNRAVEIALEGRQPLKTREVAQLVGMSPAAFARSFRGLMAISFARFALRSRLAQAAAQLVGSSDSIAKVAADWGFGGTRHFQRSFMRHYGLGPAAYRERRGRPLV